MRVVVAEKALAAFLKKSSEKLRCLISCWGCLQLRHSSSTLSMPIVCMGMLCVTLNWTHPHNPQQNVVAARSLRFFHKKKGTLLYAQSSM